MKHTAKRVLAILCMLSLIVTGWGDILPLGFLGQVAAAPMVFTKELVASDGRTYEVTVSFDVEEIPGEDGEMLQVERLLRQNEFGEEYEELRPVPENLELQVIEILEEEETEEAAAAEAEETAAAEAEEAAAEEAEEAAPEEAEEATPAETEEATPVENEETAPAEAEEAAPAEAEEAAPAEAEEATHAEAEEAVPEETEEAEETAPAEAEEATPVENEETAPAEAEEAAPAEAEEAAPVENEETAPAEAEEAASAEAEEAAPEEAEEAVPAEAEEAAPEEAEETAPAEAEEAAPAEAEEAAPEEAEEAAPVETEEAAPAETVEAAPEEEDLVAEAAPAPDKDNGPAVREPAESVPEETASEEPTAEEPAEAAPAEPAEAAPEEPVETAPAEPVEAAPEEPAEAAPAEPAEAAPAEPVEAAPAEPTETTPAEPAEAAPAEPAEPAPAEPTETAPAEPAEATPAEPAEPAPAEPAEPAPAEPIETTPEEETFLRTAEPALPEEEPEMGYTDYAEKAAETLELDMEKVSMIRVFDIFLWDPETDTEYQPETEVQVSIRLMDNELDEDKDLAVVHFGEEEEPEIMDSILEGDTVTFGTSGFSVYVVVAATIRQTLTASDGNVYAITVTYDTTSGIPENAELIVTEIGEEDEAYERYIAESAEELEIDPEDVHFARAFDISLRNPWTGVEYQPRKDVRVTIELLAESLDEGGSVDVVHFGEERAVMETTVEGDAVEFATSGFSVYVVIEHEGEEVVTPRVEFHFISGTTTSPIADSAGIYWYTSGPYTFRNKAVDADAGKLQVSMIVRDGDTLESIEAPGTLPDTGAEFFGWYVVDPKTDTVVYDPEDHTYTGEIVYSWPDYADRVELDNTISVSAEKDGNNITSITWTVDGVTNTVSAADTFANNDSMIDTEGCAHVYLAPIYSNYHFVNFHLAPRNAENSADAAYIMTRKLIVLGNSNETDIRIGDMISEYNDPVYWRFVGWEHYTGSDDDPTNDTDPAHWEQILTMHDDDTEIDNRTGKTGTYITAGAQNYELFPIFVSIRWVTYNRGAAHNGSDYLAPKYILTSDEESYSVTGFVGSDTAKRYGYVFNGWYLNAYMGNGNEILNLDGNLDVPVKDKDGNITDTIHYPRAMRLTEDDGTFCTTLRGKVFYYVDDDDIDNDIDYYIIACGDTLPAGKEKIFEIDSSGNFYMYKALYGRLSVCAKWDIPSTNIPYKVVIWMQKAEDSVDAVNYDQWLNAYKAANPTAADEQIAAAWTAEGKEKKTYDYYEYSNESATSSNNVPPSVSPSAVDLGKTTSSKTVTFNDQTMAEKDIFTGFQLGYYDQNVTVDPQGSTVLNVYYDRTIYELTFQAQDYTYTVSTNDNDNNPAKYGDVNGQKARVYWNNGAFRTSNSNYGTIYSGTVYTRSNSQSWQTIHTITAIYGHDIRNEWTFTGTNGVSYPQTNPMTSWTPQGNVTSVAQGQRLTQLIIMPNEDIVFHYTSTSNTQRTFYFYVEALPGETGETRTFEGKQYVLYKELKHDFNYIYPSTDVWDLHGFTNFAVATANDTRVTLTEGSGWQNSWNNTLYFYYSRNTYSVTFMPNYDQIINPENYSSKETINYTSGMNGTEKKTFVVQNVPYGMKLSDFAPISEIRALQGSSVAAANKYPLIPDQYKFEGWCVDGSASVKYDFDSKMPAGNLVLYGGWSMIKYRIIVDPNGGVIDHINYQTYGGNLSNTGLDTNQVYNDAYATYFNNTASEYIVTDQSVENPMVKIDSAEKAQLLAEYEEAVSAGQSPEYPIYRYVNMQFDKVESLEGGKYASYAADARNSVYIYDTQTSIEEYYNYYCQVIADKNDGTAIPTQALWESYFLSEESYRKLKTGETYTFLGWYEVNEATGKISDTEFDFSKPTSHRTKLLAQWRLDGGYTLQYTPTYTFIDGDGIEHVITGNMKEFYDPDPERTSTQYADGATTQAMAEPTEVKIDGIEDNNYQFLGWQIVRISTYGGKDHYTVPDEEVGVYYTAGQTLVIRGRYAQEEVQEDGVTRKRIIHLRAVYEKRDEATRRPEIVNLTLNAGKDAMVDAGGTPTGSMGYVNVTTIPASTLLSYPGHQYINTADHLDDQNRPTQILIGDTQSNASVHLYRYATASGEVADDGSNLFTHPLGYRLVGFDLDQYDTDFVPTYPVDSVIAVSPATAHTLYGVWEPMVYLTVVNDINTQLGTDGNVTFSLTGDTGSGGALYVVNQKNGYSREPVDPGNTYTLAPGESISFVMPYGADKNVTVHATNSLPSGYILHGDSRLGESNAATVPVRQSETAKRTLSFDLTETMCVDAEGLYVRFTEEKADRTLVFIDNLDGQGGGAQIEDNYAVAVTQSDPMSVRAEIGYQFLGWALTPDGAVAYAVGSRITDMNAFFGDDDIKTLYGKWKSLAEAHNLYVNKIVPLPGDQTGTTFTFTVTLGGYAKRGYNYSNEPFNTSTDFSQMSHGQYLHILEEQENASSGLDGINSRRVKLTITRCRLNENGQEVILETKYLYGTVSSGYYSYSTIAPIVYVTETPDSRYSTALEIENQLQYQSVNQVSVDDGTRKVTWNNPGNSGGIVKFTNIRMTAVVTVKKNLLPSTLDADDFPFAVQFLNGSDADSFEGYDLPVTSLKVTSGSTGYTISGIPTGAQLKFTETVDSSMFTTAASSTGSAGSYDDSSKAYTVTVSENTTVTFTNTLKDKKIKIVLVDDDDTPNKLQGGTFTLPRAFEGTRISGADGLIWEGTLYYSDTPYTLTQQSAPDSSHRKLQTAVTFTVDSSGVNVVPGTGLSVSYDSVTDVYTITVVNPIQIPVTVKKVIEAASASLRQGTFGFTAVLKDASNNPVQMSNVIGNQGTDANGTIEFTLVNNQTVTLYVPRNVNLTITETADEAFDTEFQTGTAADSLGAATESYTATLNSIDGNRYVLFTNTLKTIEVTVKKHLVDAAGGSGTFTFTAYLQKSTNERLAGYTLCDGIVTGDDGRVQFTLAASVGSDGQKVFTIPSGSRLTITETLQTADYETSAAGANSSEAVGTYNPATGAFTLNQLQTLKDVTVTFTNTKKVNVTVRKTLEDPDENLFLFTATLTKSDGAAVEGCKLFEGGTTDSSGRVTFTLDCNIDSDTIPDQITLSVPMGANLDVTESGARTAASEPNIIGDYETTASDSASKGTYTSGTRTYAVTDVRETLSITFVNVGGTEVKFKKTDGFGNALGGASFALFSSYDYALAALNVGVPTAGTEGIKGIKVLSSGDFEPAYYVTSEGSFSDTGSSAYNVRFKAPAGTWYMVETNQVSGYEANTNIYQVDVSGGTYTVQRMADDSTVDGTLNIAASGIMNVSLAQRRVILRKGNGGETPLPGAVFDILAWDRTVVYDDQTALSGLTSQSSGVIWIGELPYGTYYLREHTDTVGSYYWFTLTVDSDEGSGGVTCSSRSPTASANPT